MTVINVTGSCTINVVGSAVINVQEQDGGGGGGDEQAGEVPGNLIGNGAFGTDLAGWTLPNGAESAVWVDGKAVNNNGDENMQRTISPLTVGANYVLSIDVEIPEGGTIGVGFKEGFGDVLYAGGYSTSGTKTFSFTAANAIDGIRIDFGGEAGPGYTVDNVTLLPA